LLIFQDGIVEGLHIGGRQKERFGQNKVYILFQCRNEAATIAWILDSIMDRLDATDSKLEEISDRLNLRDKQDF
jgi:hypothetical protein